MKEKTKEKKIEALIFLSVAPKEELVNLGKQLSKIDKVKKAYEILGNYDLVLFVTVSSRTELGQVIDYISTLKGVNSLSTFIFTERIK